jgi:DNA-binding Xre family transcriptional regulator
MSSTALIAALKHATKARGWRHRDLAAALNMSESGLKKSLSGPDMPLSRLMAICATINIELGDLLAAANAQRGHLRLTAEQEAFFVRSPATFHVFRGLLDHDLDVPTVESRLGLDRASMRIYLGELSQLDLLTLLPDDRVRLSTPGPWSLKMSSALGAVVIADVQQTLLRHAQIHHAQRGAEQELGMGQYRLSPDSLADFRAEMRALLESYARRARVDALTESDDALIEVGALGVVAPFAIIDAVTVPRRALGGSGR